MTAPGDTNPAAAAEVAAADLVSHLDAHISDSSSSSEDEEEKETKREEEDDAEPPSQSQQQQDKDASPSSAHHRRTSVRRFRTPRRLRTTASSTAAEHDRLSSDLALFLSNPSLKAALADGSLDLTSYGAEVDAELESLESECIGIYREKAPEVAKLRDEIDDCDAVLASLQEMLLGFQADLGGLSGDIRTLQDQSQRLGVKLRNRRAAEEGLRLFLERIVVAPNLAECVCRGPVDETFVACVEELNRKHAYVHSRFPADDPTLEASCGIPPAETAAGKEMQDHVRKLRLVAVRRVREHFLSRIAELRRPKTNVRMMQVNGLLKYSVLNDFLAQASPDIYNEVRGVYVESMGKTLHALFRTYAAQLSRLDARIAGRGDLIAVDDASLRDAFSTRVNMNKRSDPFVLGDRASVLESASGGSGGRGPILAHVALAERETYPYERLFDSVVSHLMDAATNEYVFVRQFFKESGREAFGALFSRTLGLVLEQLENYLFDCHDALALLLMIKIVHRNRRVMKSRKVPVLDAFFDGATNLLWPRLKVVVDAQIRSVRTGNAKKLGLAGGDGLHAHFVSRRYAEFTCSVLLILHKGRKGRGGGPAGTGSPDDDDEDDNGGGAGEDLATSDASATSSNAARKPPSHRGTAGDMLVRDVSLLLEETVRLLERLGDVHTSQKKRIVFLINNLDQIVTIFQERRVSGAEYARFVDLLMHQRELFVEEELLQGFSKMIAFVQQTEGHMTGIGRGGSGSGGSGDARLDVNAGVVQSLVSEFASTWKQSIEQINRNVLSYFSNFRNGMEILKQVLTQLLLYYTRFQDIIRKVWRNKPPAFCKDLVSTTVILAEIKKYALAI